MKALIKLGGTLLDAPELRASLAAQIAAQAQRGIEIAVVHGGGKQMTRFLAERGIESRFVNGLRVTTPETMDAVLKVLAGSVNQELVAALIAAGARAVGLSGVDANLVEAEQMDPALGMVGRVTRANPELLDLLVGAGYLPVVACVAGRSRWAHVQRERRSNGGSVRRGVACGPIDLSHGHRRRTGCVGPGAAGAEHRGMPSTDCGGRRHGWHAGQARTRRARRWMPVWTRSRLRRELRQRCWRDCLTENSPERRSYAPRNG